MTVRLLTVLILFASVSAPQLPPPPDVDPRHRAYDLLLDTNVRDGLVYYRAVQGSRAGLNRYVASMDMPADTFKAMSRD